MKLSLASLLCLCAVPLFTSDHTQARSVPEMIAMPAFFLFDSFPPFDSYGDNVSTSDEKARLDNLVFYLRKEPDKVAYIFAYGGRQGCAGEAQKRLNRIRHHLVKTRGVAADRVVLQDVGYRESMTVELFLWPRGASPPTSRTVDPSDVQKRMNCKPKTARHDVRQNRHRQ